MQEANTHILTFAALQDNFSSSVDRNRKNKEGQYSHARQLKKDRPQNKPQKKAGNVCALIAIYRTTAIEQLQHKNIRKNTTIIK